MEKFEHPYAVQPDKAFWRKTVVDKHPLDVRWYTKKFAIDNQPIATAGSCFAQHIGRNLREKGFNYIDAELAPNFLQQSSHLDYGYGMYSARYGNIYTSRQLLQLLQRALGEFQPREDYWIKDDGFVDPFRPTIEHEPFASLEELRASRQHHLDCVLDIFNKADVFVYTLGLTEAWTSLEDGAVFPIAPGVSGGQYDPVKYKLHNLGFQDVLADMRSFIDRVRSINSKMKFLLTVSPVPLMATATNHNVVVATSYSKSVLRAVAGQLAVNRSYVDYFPSFEIISSHIMRGQFYNPDMRTVAEYGVNHVMKQFFAEHLPPEEKKPIVQPDKSRTSDDVMCDEELLAAFGEVL